MHAIGGDGYGLIAVKNVPGVMEMRQSTYDCLDRYPFMCIFPSFLTFFCLLSFDLELLPLAHEIANLPEEKLKKIEHSKSSYSFGWSQGRETYHGGRFDAYKGSFYNNPQYNVPTTDQALIDEHIESLHPNIWPEDLPDVEKYFMQAGQLVVSVGMLLARECDTYVKKAHPAYAKAPKTMEDVIKESLTCKARLLYYFPIKGDESVREVDSWCGWHNDHGSLTGLLPNMFLSLDGKETKNTDPTCGLYCKTRDGSITKVSVPPDCIAFQIGEASQIMTGGFLKATPHAVKAPEHPHSESFGRATLAVFMQPNHDVLMQPPAGLSLKDCGVERMADKEPVTFAVYAKSTIAGYY